MSEHDTTTMRVPPEQAGVRLDVFLGRALGVGRAQVKKALEAGRVRINGRRVGLKHKGDFLEGGAAVEVGGQVRPEDLTIVPQPELPVTVLDEGEGWAVVDKPAGMAVHPLAAGETGTVLNFVAARWPEVQGVGEGGLRSGVVHRLDVETSGVLIVATEQAVWEGLRDAFSAHDTRKVYRAIVHGELSGRGKEVMDLVVAQHRPAKVRVVRPGEDRPAGTRKCHLEWEAKEKLPEATLVEVNLGTGFLHQIRVMFAAIGHPVMGDRTYGREDRAVRQMLHAARLDVGGITVESPDPPDLATLLAELR